NVMLTKTCSGCFSCRKSAKTKFLQVIGQLKQPVQHYIYATTIDTTHSQILKTNMMIRKLKETETSWTMKKAIN
ncbi:MAG: hypothetical protein ACKVTZ_19675, partial [Bacteroidia bacterium]